MGCVRTILLLIEAKALRLGTNKNNRSRLIMNNFRNGTVVMQKCIISCFHGTLSMSEDQNICAARKVSASQETMTCYYSAHCFSQGSVSGPTI